METTETTPTQKHYADDDVRADHGVFSNLGADLDHRARPDYGPGADVGAFHDDGPGKHGRRRIDMGAGMHKRLLRYARGELGTPVEMAEQLDQGEAGVAGDDDGARELGRQFRSGEHDAAVRGKRVAFEDRLRFDEVDEAVLESLLGRQPLDVA